MGQNPKKTKMTVTIDKSLLEEMDNFIKEKGMTKSSLVGIACRMYMDSSKVMNFMDMASKLSGKIVSGEVKVDDESIKSDAELLNAIWGEVETV